MMKKQIALLLCFVLLAAGLTACAGNGSKGTLVMTTKAQTEAVSRPAVDTSGFRLSYSKADSLDPFKSETLNNQVVQNLVYESLFILDESYEAESVIAEGYSYPTPEKLNVTIKQGLKFSDGSGLSAENIVYSFEQAKESPHWETVLENFGEAEIENAYSVTFTLKSPNPNAHKLLTFAVARAKENNEGYKIGSGRYRFASADGGVILQVNDYYPGFSPSFTKINLVNITSGESIENAINIGNISYAFRNLSDGSNTKINSAVKTVNLNNLVYIGIHSTGGICKDKNIRRAISLAIDRDTLVKSAYRGYAKSAKSIFNPASAIGKQTELFDTKADTMAARQALAGADTEDGLTLRLLCDKNEGRRGTAKLLKQQLEAAGFKVDLDIQSASGYREKVQSGAYDIYIGETKLPTDMGLQSFFTDDGGTRYGIDLDDGKTAKAYLGYLEGENEIGTFLLDFSEELPFIPLLYRQGMICYTKSLRGDMQGYEGNYFSNIQDWYYN